MQDKNIAIIIPTFNEVNNIAVIIEKIFSLEGNFFILVVDDDSPDKTSQKVRDLQKDYPNLDLITKPYRLGLKSAYLEGFEYALSRRYDLIIQIDADLSHPYTCIPPMLKLLDRYDLVIGSRYIKGAGVYNWPLNRVLLSRLGNIFAKFMLQLPVNDLTSGFKCMKRSVLESIDFDTILSEGYFFQIEMVFRAFLKGIRIVEYPIRFQGRSKGISKMSLRIIFEAIYRVVVLWFKKTFKKCLPL
jgi:dolichol-phosphate mannosyltransferase